METILISLALYYKIAYVYTSLASAHCTCELCIFSITHIGLNLAFKMEAETFDEESNQALSQINIDLQVNDDLFDIGSDSVLSQFMFCFN